MIYTEAEIVAKFRNAIKQKEMVSILSQLNGCDEKRIEDILIRNGVGRDEISKKRKKQIWHV